MDEIKTLQDFIASNAGAKREIALFAQFPGSFEELLKYLESWYAVRNGDDDALAFVKEHVCLELHEGVLSFEASCQVYVWNAQEKKWAPRDNVDE